MKFWLPFLILFSAASFAQSRSAGDETQQLLQALADAPGPSGFEEPVRKIMVEHMKPMADKLSYDGLGSVIAVQGTSGPRIMVDAHMDELGGMIRVMDDAVQSRLKRMDQRGLSKRYITPYSVDELTSRKSAVQIPDILDRLETPFGTKDDERRDPLRGWWRVEGGAGIERDRERLDHDRATAFEVGARDRAAGAQRVPRAFESVPAF